MFSWIVEVPIRSQVHGLSAIVDGRPLARMLRSCDFEVVRGAAQGEDLLQARSIAPVNSSVGQSFSGELGGAVNPVR